MEEHWKLERSFRRALQSGELSLEYQPYFDLPTGKGRGAEALARWQLASGECVAPSVFIPMAERTGRIHAMGAWALKAACETAQGWSNASTGRMILSVNVSALQVNRQFSAVISECLRGAAFPPAQLELEITESVFLHNTELSIACLEDWKNIGVHIALDDFGTGYSNLAYLCRLPIDRLKIDQSLIQHLGIDKRSAIVLRSIIGLGADLGLNVIAEGVETHLQLRILTDLGCPQAQGFLLARPVRAPLVHAILRKPWGICRTPGLDRPNPAAANPPALRATSLTKILGRKEAKPIPTQRAEPRLPSSHPSNDCGSDSIGNLTDRGLPDVVLGKRKPAVALN